MSANEQQDGVNAAPSDSSNAARTRKVLVADGVRLTREGVCELLQGAGLLVSESSAVPAELAQALAADQVDLVVCNAATVDLAGLVAAARSVSDVPIVAMSVSETVADVALCAELDLAGFVLADDSVTDLLHVIQTAELGRSQCPAHAVPILMQALRSRATQALDHGRLTARESQIARLLQEGLANKEIAIRLGIAPRTVKNHLHHVYDKLGVHSRGEVVALMRQPGMS